MLDCLENYIITILNLLSIYLVSGCLFAPSLKLSKKRVFLVLFIIGIGSTWEVIGYGDRLSFLNIFLNGLCFMLISEEKIQENLKIYLISNFVADSVRGIFYFLITLVTHSKMDDIMGFSNKLTDIFCTIPSVIFLTGLFLLLYRKKREYHKIPFSNFLICFLSVFFAGFGVTFVLYYFDSGKNTSVYMMNQVASGLLACSSISLFAAAFSIGKLTEMEYLKSRELAMVRETATMTKDYFVELYGKTEQMKRYQHDMRHIIRTVQVKLDNKEYESANQLLESLYGTYNVPTDRINYSGNKFVDSTIYGTLGKYITENRITFEYQGYLPEEIAIEDIDLCAAIGNVLENALEACIDIIEPVPVIKMKAIQKGNVYCFEIENPIMNGDDKFVLRSKKDSETHGYGIKNIREIVEKYQGSYEYEVVDGCFLARLTFLETEKVRFTK